jgi:hypothetical protein
MMNEMKKIDPLEADLPDPMLQSAVRHFRASVHAWSDAAHNRPRSVLSPAPHVLAWRRIAAWTLSLALSVGIVGTAEYERHRYRVIAQEKQHLQEMERQRATAEQRAQEAEDLMANIDSDISRQVPAAMEPLALTTDGTQ